MTNRDDIHKMVRCTSVNRDGYWEVKTWDADSKKEKTAAYIDSVTGRVLYIEDTARTDADVQAAVQDRVKDAKREHPFTIEEFEKYYLDMWEFMLRQTRGYDEFVDSLYVKIDSTGTKELLTCALRFIKAQKEDIRSFAIEAKNRIIEHL